MITLYFFIECLFYVLSEELNWKHWYYNRFIERLLVLGLTLDGVRISRFFVACF